MTNLIKKNHFTGGRNTSGTREGTLSDVVRGLAIDNARTRLAVLAAGAAAPNYVNNAGGTVRGTILTLPVPTTAFDASSAGGVTRTALDAALLTAENAHAALAAYINDVNRALGLPVLTGVVGSLSSGEIAAVTASATGGTGTDTPTRATVAAAFTAARNNIATLARAANKIAAACGITRLTDNSGGSASFAGVIVDVPTTTLSASGADSVAKTTVDAYLANMRDDVQTIGALVNSAVTQTPQALNVLAAD